MHLRLSKCLLAALAGRGVDLGSALGALVAQGRLHDFEVLGPHMVLRADTDLIVWTNQLFKLDLMLGLNWDPLGQ